MSLQSTLLETFSFPAKLLFALRSDHAGETGAVAIYRGILAVSRDPELRAFATEHMVTESRHLDLIEQVLAPELRSRLLPLWRLAGFVTGALPALFGARAVYRTIDAVETFVDAHYARQIEYLRDHFPDARLQQLLQACREDEIRHRDEARARIGEAGIAGRLWTALVGAGSSVGVFFASRF